MFTSSSQNIRPCITIHSSRSDNEGVSPSTIPYTPSSALFTPSSAAPSSPSSLTTVDTHLTEGKVSAVNRQWELFVRFLKPDSDLPKKVNDAILSTATINRCAEEVSQLLSAFDCADFRPASEPLSAEWQEYIKVLYSLLHQVRALSSSGLECLPTYYPHAMRLLGQSVDDGNIQDSVKFFGNLYSTKEYAERSKDADSLQSGLNNLALDVDGFKAVFESDVEEVAQELREEQSRIMEGSQALDFQLDNKRLKRIEASVLAGFHTDLAAKKMQLKRVEDSQKVFEGLRPLIGSALGDMDEVVRYLTLLVVIFKTARNAYTRLHKFSSTLSMEELATDLIGVDTKLASADIAELELIFRAFSNESLA